MKLDLAPKSRSRVLAYLLTGVLAVIVVRLFYLQVIAHEHYVQLASREQVKKLVIPAKRGMIYASNKESLVPLVMNQEVYTMFADPTVVTDPAKVEAVAQEIAGGNIIIEDMQSKLKDKSTQYVVIAKNVSLRQAEMIKQKKVKGVGFQKVSKRVYPEGSLAAHTLGFVDNDGQGQYGVESKLNDELMGKDGLLKSVTDVANVPLSIGKDNIRRDAVDGKNIALTIDRNIQSKAEEALANGIRQAQATHGNVMIMNPNNGHILAMTTYPSYNPAEFYKADVASYVNNTISMPYEPGSDLKTFTVAMGIDKGIIDADSTYVNTDRIQVEDRTIRNAFKGLTGTITMQTALSNSLNTGMVTIAQRLGDGKRITRTARDTMYDYLHNKFRLGEKTGVELQGEAKGTVISPEEGEGNSVRYSNMSFGQGLDVTMIQVVSAFSAIINGGTYYQPSVIAGTVEDGALKPAQPRTSYPGVIKAESSLKTKEMVHKARTSYTKNDTPGYYIGGKTGTSETIINGKYVDNQTIGTYLGFGGGSATSTKYVIMVEVSADGKNLEGGKHAMPIFTDISNWLLNYYQIQPGK